MDAQIAIYTIDVHPTYGPVCRPLWSAVRAGAVVAVSSELTLMETLVAPMRYGDAVLAANREALWQQPNTRLLPITQDILRRAALLRATVPALKTPDAIHAATSLMHSCDLFLTNDIGFRRIPGLKLAILDEVLSAP